MIPAIEALRLARAQLSEEELETVKRIESEIDGHIREGFGRNGVDILINEVRLPVIAELSQRAKQAGYAPQWEPRIQTHRLNTALREVVGYILHLQPSDASYQAADAVVQASVA